MVTIRIYWQDLSKNMQSQLKKIFGNNMNWDIFPISVVEIDDIFTPGTNVEIDSVLGNKGLEDEAV